MFGKGAKKPQGAEPISLTKKEDDLGRYPNEVDSSPSEARAQQRALRAVSLVAIVAGMMCIALIMLIITIFPLQRVYPYLVTFKKQDNQVVSIEPMSAGAPGMLYATEDAVRDYIVQRHSFTPSTTVMGEQWGPNSRLAARTATEVYQKFAQASKDELSRMLTLGYVRTITINSVNRISGDTWQVNFKTHDQPVTVGGTLTQQATTTAGAVPPAGAQTAGTNGTPTPVVAGGTPVTVGPSTTSAQGFAGGTGAPVVAAAATDDDNDQNWIATMRVEYQPQRVTYDKRLLNPLGFTVTDYSVTRSTR